MKKSTWLFLTPIILFFISCTDKGDQSPPPAVQSYIKFKLDNNQVQCTSLITASYFTSVPDSQLTINGAWSTGSFKLEISGSNSPLVPGNYTFAANKWHSGHIFTNSPAGRFVAGMDLFLNSFNGSGNVNITDISPQYVKGTFEFITGIDSSNPSLPAKTVTAGEFYVKRG